MSGKDKQMVPPVGITMGCPASVGPEVIVKFFSASSRARSVEAVVIGDAAILEWTAKQLGTELAVVPWRPGSRPRRKALNVLPVTELSPLNIQPGSPTIETGLAMAAYVERAIELCLDGTLAGLTTCPISKRAFNLAGYAFPGHTELLSQRSGSDQAVMMMAGSSLRVTLATIHCALSAVPSLLSSDSLLRVIRITDRALKKDFDIDRPVIGIAGLNPHAGEDGLFGTEERVTIAPAITKARASGILAEGPYPADTIFNKAVAGQFDAVVCMYHDQGLIPFKLLHFSDGVNVTLGLPIVRTSVDHGTGYDIAGRGIADYRSLEAAVTLAGTIAANRRRSGQNRQA